MISLAGLIIMLKVTLVVHSDPTENFTKFKTLYYNTFEELNDR